MDAARDYAQHIPMRVIADLLGFPPEDGPRFREFVENVLESIDQPPEERLGHQDELAAYLVTQIQGHLAEPRDDLTTYLVNAELDGRKLDPVHVVGTMMLLLIAGVDTTWSAIGASLWHLAATPADRERLAARPALLPVAIEEFLRAYAPVTMARLVKQDMHFNGVDMRADDWVLLSFPAANRDPARFERADEVLIDREENRHAAFGLGVHRCVGSHLARMELRVALEVWLERVPAFTLADPAAVTWAASQVRGPVPCRSASCDRCAPGGPAPGRRPSGYRGE
ncbi:cytochrome P450 [Nonomuraea thailandensis]